jgi:4-hydroxybenzoate polyprenyltransferase
VGSDLCGKDRFALSLKPYLQLIRLPNLFTAAADSLAGWLIVGGALADMRGWAPLVAASAGLYAAGIVLNDIIDLEIDRKERPFRPLPSGGVGRRAAGLIFAVTLALGVGLPIVWGSGKSALIATLLALAIITYDAGAKRTIAGPLFMGLCRALNLLVGLSVVADFGGWPCWLASTSYGLFVAGITCLSRSEASDPEKHGPALGLIFQDVALLGLLIASLALAGRQPGSRAPLAVLPLESLLVLAIVGLVVNQASGQAVVQPSGAKIGRAVKTGILSLVWIVAGLTCATRGVAPAVAVAALWFPAVLLGKWLYST